jgi:hypothetical protein
LCKNDSKRTGRVIVGIVDKNGDLGAAGADDIAAAIGGNDVESVLGHCLAVQRSEISKIV